MNEFILETFSDLCKKYDMKVNLKTKRTFQLFVMENIPFSEKEVIRKKLELITKEMGRKTFTVHNPTVKTIADETIVTSGIWDIRIY